MPPAGAAVCDICPNCRTFYVRSCGPPACDDANDGSAPSRAWSTLRHAAEFLRDHGSPGDVVIAGPGTYAERNVDLRLSTNILRPLMFLADETGSCTGDAPGIVLVDAHSSDKDGAGFLVFGASHAIVAGFHITGGYDAGIQVLPGPLGAPAEGAVLANNVIFGNGHDCATEPLPCTRGGRGIEVKASPGATVFNNLIFDNVGVGISVGDLTTPSAPQSGSPNARLINNTIVGHDYGIVVGRGTGSVSPGAWVINNIIAEASEFAIDVNAESTCDYAGPFNLIASAEDRRYSDTAPRDPSDIHVPELSDVSFNAPDADDYRLTEASPAIDAGSAPAALLALDHSSARADTVLDSGVVDLGYHAGSIGVPDLAMIPVEELLLYVRADGDDGDVGRTPDHAFRTIGHALERSRAQTRIVVGPGEYHEAVAPHRLKPSGLIEFYADALGAFTGDAPGRVLVDAGGGADGFNITQHCSAVIDGFAVTNAKGNGIFVKNAHRAVIRNNQSFSNGSLGIQVADSEDVEVSNNLVYDNGNKEQNVGGGIQVGGQVGTGSPRAIVENNTAYGNGVNGILIGTAADVSQGARVRYNIMSGNGQNGLQLNNATNAGASLDSICIAFNVNADGYGPIRPEFCDSCLDPKSDHGLCTDSPCLRTEAGCRLEPAEDLRQSPQLANPRGADGCLGKHHFWDDDFRLSRTSPAIDFSMESAAAVGLDDRTTQTDNSLDVNQVDAGFHSLPVAFTDVPAMVGDCNGDGCVRVDELVRGVSIALGTAELESCTALDRDGDGRVTVAELVAAVGEAFCCAG